VDIPRSTVDVWKSFIGSKAHQNEKLKGAPMRRMVRRNRTAKTPGFSRYRRCHMRQSRNEGLFWFIVLFGAVFLWNPVTAFSTEKKIVGLIEKVMIFPGALEVSAKIDTGARNSSLDATHVVEFERGGGKWVRFEVMNGRGQKREIEAEVIKTVLIKRHKSSSARRYVVRLGICLGSIYREVEVNLEDRTGFNYHMLIGRSFLEGLFVVDPSLRFTTRPQCREIPRE
jgi:hypothetical protein